MREPGACCGINTILVTSSGIAGAPTTASDSDESRSRVVGLAGCTLVYPKAVGVQWARHFCRWPFADKSLDKPQNAAVLVNLGFSLGK
jgi:hypothetical protein